MTRILFAAALWLVGCAAALAQEGFPTTGGGRVPGQAVMGVTDQALPIGVFPGVNGNYLHAWPDQTKQLFVDDFGTGTLNTISRWQAPTTGGGGNAVAATNAVANTVLSSGTAASGWSLLQTQIIFNDRNPSYLDFQTNVNTILPGVINSVTFFGFGNVPGAITTAAYCTNCVGFEIGTDGKLRAVTWASGTRNIVADLSVSQGPSPQATGTIDGAFTAGCSCTPQESATNGGSITKSFRYLIRFRGDHILFYTEDPNTGLSRLVAYTTRGASGPDVNQETVTFLVVNGATPPSAATTLTVNQVTVGDTGGNPVILPPVVSGAANGAPTTLKASPGALIRIDAECAAACWLMVFNATAPPADGATTIGTASGNLQQCIGIPVAGSSGVINYVPGPYEHYSVGISAALSSNAAGCASKTSAAVAGFIHGMVQ